jgi:hypothetical protein
MNNFYDKSKTLKDVEIIDDYNPIDKGLIIRDVIPYEIVDYKYRKYLGKIFIHGCKFLVEIYIRHHVSGIVTYGILYTLDYLDSLYIQEK